MSDIRRVGTFPHFDDKYKCCCSTIHITHGARLVLLSEFIVIWLLALAVLFTPTVDASITQWIEFVLHLAGLVLAFVAMKKSASKYLVPYMVVSVIAILDEVLMYAANHIIVTSPDSTLSDVLKATVDHPVYEKIREEHKYLQEAGYGHEGARRVAFIQTAGMVLWFLDVFFFYVLYKYYRYLKDMERYYATVKHDIEARY